MHDLVQLAIDSGIASALVLFGVWLGSSARKTENTMGRKKKTTSNGANGAPASKLEAPTETRTYAFSRYERQDIMRYAERALCAASAPIDPEELADWAKKVGVALVLAERALDAEPDPYRGIGPVTVVVEADGTAIDRSGEVETQTEQTAPPPPPPLTDAERALLRFPASGAVQISTFADFPELGTPALQELFDKEWIAHAGLQGLKITPAGEARSRELMAAQANPLPVGGAS